MKPSLDLLPVSLDIYRFDGDAAIPPHLFDAPWTWIARTNDELSIVCPPNAAFTDAAQTPASEVSADWSVLRVKGPIAHTVVGVLAGLSGVLASEGISIFALSTFDTDYVLVRTDQVDPAIRALRAAGYTVRRQS